MTAALRRRMAELPFRELYEVGGSLRDELLGREPKDIDFLVRGHDVEELLTICRAARQGRRAARRRPPRGRALLAAVGAARGHRGRAAAARDADRAGRARLHGQSAHRLPHRGRRRAAGARRPRAPRLHGQRDGAGRAHGRVDRSVRRARRSRRARAARGARDGVPRRPAAHPARRRALQPRRPAARCGHARADDRRRRRASPSCRPSASARSSSACSRAPAPSTRCGSRATSARSRWRCPSGRRASGCDQQSDDAGLHARRAHPARARRPPSHDGAAREPRLAAFWHDVGKPHAAGRAAHAEAGASIARARAAAPDLRQRHDRRRDGARARALLRRGSRADRARARACSWRASGASAPRDLLALRRWDRAGRGVPIPAERVAARERFETLVERAVGPAGRRSPTSRCAATT